MVILLIMFNVVVLTVIILIALNIVVFDDNLLIIFNVVVVISLIIFNVGFDGNLVNCI